MSVCVMSGGMLTVLAVTGFTLSWTHSVEKVRWEEDWRVTSAGLEVVEARVKGSGAGMEPPTDAVLKHGWWVYAPKLPARDRIMLAASGATSSGWTLCAAADCREFGAENGGAVEIFACDGAPGAAR